MLKYLWPLNITFTKEAMLRILHYQNLKLHCVVYAPGYEYSKLCCCTKVIPNLTTLSKPNFNLNAHDIEVKVRFAKCS